MPGRGDVIGIICGLTTIRHIRRLLRLVHRKLFPGPGERSRTLCRQQHSLRPDLANEETRDERLRMACILHRKHRSNNILRS